MRDDFNYFFITIEYLSNHNKQTEGTVVGSWQSAICFTSQYIEKCTEVDISGDTKRFFESHKLEGSGCDLIITDFHLFKAEEWWQNRPLRTRGV